MCQIRNQVGREYEWNVLRRLEHTRDRKYTCALYAPRVRRGSVLLNCNVRRIGPAILNLDQRIKVATDSRLCACKNLSVADVR